MSEISQNVSDVAFGSDEITSRITEVADVAQRASAQAASVKSAAEELMSFADQLQQRIQMFKI